MARRILFIAAASVLTVSGVIATPAVLAWYDML